MKEAIVAAYGRRADTLNRVWAWTEPRREAVREDHATYVKINRAQLLIARIETMIGKPDRDSRRKLRRQILHEALLGS